MVSDGELLARVLAGDVGGFEELVRKYQSRLFNTIFHVLGNVHDAEELTQEAFLKAWSHLAEFRQASSFYTWLYRIAMNLVATRRRLRRGNAPLEIFGEQTGSTVTDHRNNPSGFLESEEICQQVREALGKLPPAYREILVLREIEGLDYRAIAEVLGIPVNTVRSRLFRARMELRDRVAPFLPKEV